MRTIIVVERSNISVIPTNRELSGKNTIVPGRKKGQRRKMLGCEKMEQYSNKQKYCVAMIAKVSAFLCPTCVCRVYICIIIWHTL